MTMRTNLANRTVLTVVNFGISEYAIKCKDPSGRILIYDARDLRLANGSKDDSFISSLYEQ